MAINHPNATVHLSWNSINVSLLDSVSFSVSLKSIYLLKAHPHYAFDNLSQPLKGFIRYSKPPNKPTKWLMCFRFVKAHQIRNLQHLHFWVHGSPSKILQNNERAPDPSLQHSCGSLWILNKWGRFCRNSFPQLVGENFIQPEKWQHSYLSFSRLNLWWDKCCKLFSCRSYESFSPCFNLISFEVEKVKDEKVHRAIISSLASKPRHMCAFSQNCRVRYICESSCSIPAIHMIAYCTYPSSQNHGSEKWVPRSVFNKIPFQLQNRFMKFLHFQSLKNLWQFWNSTLRPFNKEVLVFLQQTIDISWSPSWHVLWPSHLVGNTPKPWWRSDSTAWRSQHETWSIFLGETWSLDGETWSHESDSTSDFLFGGRSKLFTTKHMLLF